MGPLTAKDVQVSGIERYERMAQRARERAARRAAEERAVLLRRAAESPGFAPDQLDGEGSQIFGRDEHNGHRTHINFLHHGNSVVCSCGAHMGIFSFVMPTDEVYAEMQAADPGYCPVCRARGVSSPSRPH